MESMESAARCTSARWLLPLSRSLINLLQSLALRRVTRQQQRKRSVSRSLLTNSASLLCSALEKQVSKNVANLFLSLAHAVKDSLQFLVGGDLLQRPNQNRCNNQFKKMSKWSRSQVTLTSR